jgi:hypothetical protein
VYLRALKPSTAAAMGADYRAGFHFDREHDAKDRAAGLRITCPALLVTGEDETQLADAATVWRAWTKDSLPGEFTVATSFPRKRPGSLATSLPTSSAGARPRSRVAARPGPAVLRQLAGARSRGLRSRQLSALHAT